MPMIRPQPRYGEAGLSGAALLYPLGQRREHPLHRTPRRCAHAACRADCVRTTAPSTGWPHRARSRPGSSGRPVALVALGVGVGVGVDWRLGTPASWGSACSPWWIADTKPEDCWRPCWSGTAYTRTVRPALVRPERRHPAPWSRHLVASTTRMPLPVVSAPAPVVLAIFSSELPVAVPPLITSRSEGEPSLPR